MTRMLPTLTTSTQFAAAALALPLPIPPLDGNGKPFLGLAAACWLCGGPTGGIGFRQVDAILPTFTQQSYVALTDSDAVCRPCVAFTRVESFQALIRTRNLPVKLWPQAGWHAYSHFVTADGYYEAPSRPNRVRDILLDPPSVPFVLGLNPTGLKHTLFRTRVATSRDVFPVHFEDRTSLVDRVRFKALVGDLEHMSELGFSKEQTMTGRYQTEAIRRAGIAAWRAGEMAMRPWRDSEPDLLALAAWVGRSPKWYADRREQVSPQAAQGKLL